MLSQWMSPWINKRRTDKVLSSGFGFKKEQTSSCRNPPMSMIKWIGCGPEISKKSWEIPSESTSFYGPPKEILGEYIETTLTHINYSNWIAFVCNWVALAYFDYSNWVDQQLLESSVDLWWTNTRNCVLFCTNIQPPPVIRHSRIVLANTKTHHGHISAH